MSRVERIGISVLFFGFLALYLHTVAPHLAPYRDAGEMVSLLSTLGVAHSPGYPLYTLAGRIFSMVPLGNIAYRVNVFSAVCAAGALVFLFLSLRKWTGAVPAMLATAFLGFSNPFWDLATVSEMYALGALLFCALIYTALCLDEPLLFAFLMALGLGVRMDMLLLVPLFVAWFWWGGKRKELPWMGLFFMAGASVFLYLMFRSLTNPAIDWANPDNLVAVLNSARRKNYSGTLDLLSLSYRTGENFLINLRLYGIHLVDVFRWWGVAVALLGLWGAWKSERRIGIFLGVIFLVTCPVFLFLANMPPNPHALAIVEASYLVPDIVVSIFIGFGVGRVRALTPTLSLKGEGVTLLLFTGLLALNAIVGFHRASKRYNLYARDYVENVFRSAPRNSVAVFHKDVQLFTLWAAQLVDGRRPDLSLVSWGLSASPWYWDMKHRWKTAPSPAISVKDSSGWSQLLAEIGTRALVAGYDVEFSANNKLKPRAHGLLMALNGSDDASKILSALCLYRGRYVYGTTPDFFSTDLIGDHARATQQHGFDAMMAKKTMEAEMFLRRAEALDPTSARPSSDRGYIAFMQGDFLKAYDRYAVAARKLDRTLENTIEYKSLPEVRNTYLNEAAVINTQWGAMAERLGRKEEARALYARSLNIRETAQAHYNLAVTYWGTDWNRVISHMRRAAELDPQMREAQVYLAKAMTLRGKS